MDEAARHQLYNSLESTLGPEPTRTLMSLLPPGMITLYGIAWATITFGG